MENEVKSAIGFGTTITFVIVACIGGGLWGCPRYNVYSSQLSGQAKLAEAQGERMSAVVTAKAKMDSAKYEADAEIIRARGVAAANDIIADRLGGHENYLRYLYIQNLEHSQNRIIYIPTEGGLPILEAGKR